MAREHSNPGEIRYIPSGAAVGLGQIFRNGTLDAPAVAGDESDRFRRNHMS